jgi:cytochrome P450
VSTEALSSDAPAEWDAFFDDDDAEDGIEFIPASAEGKPEHSEIDISSKDFWNQTSEEREHRFKLLRETDPVSWQRPVEDAVTPDPDDPGYWALVKHEHIVKVSRDNDTFISGQGVLFDLLPEIFLQMTQSFLAMDNPKHDKLRKLVSAAFTPKQVRRLEEQIATAAREVVDSFASESGDIDFVERCGERLPERIFCDMFGIPEHMRTRTVKAAGDIVAWADPEYLAGRPADEVQVEAAATLHEIAEELIALRREEPGEDLMTALLDAEVDGEQLDDFDIGAFLVLMSVAGTDTTKHTSAFTVRAMTHHPEQREWLMADYDGRIDTAVEEFVRYASPVMTFRRTAVRETELGGKTILPGDKVVMFYPSGNQDADVFTEPERFELSRKPNPHVGFGGGGAHFCLGNQLAKSALRALFRELLTRIPDFEAGEPELLGTNFMRGVKRLPFRFTPETRA